MFNNITKIVEIQIDETFFFRHVKNDNHRSSRRIQTKSIFCCCSFPIFRFLSLYVYYSFIVLTFAKIVLYFHIIFSIAKNKQFRLHEQERLCLPHVMDGTDIFKLFGEFLIFAHMPNASLILFYRKTIFFFLNFKKRSQFRRAWMRQMYLG